MSTISLVVAMGHNRVIGRDNRLPWRMPADMKRFRELTVGNAVLMGRKTYESIGKPLTGRHNIVLTRDPDYTAWGCTVVHSVAEALQAPGEGDVMVIGGGQIYRLMLAMSDRIYMTLIDGQFEGDSTFPRLDMARWREVSYEICPADEDNPYRYAFVELERRRTAG